MLKAKNFILASIIVFFALFVFSLPTASSSTLRAEPLPTTEGGERVQDQVELAILEAIASNDRYIQKGLVPSIQVTDIRTSTDQKQATAWVVYYDPQIDAVLPLEPGLAVTHFVGDRWQVYLPSNPAWQDEISKLPVELLTQDEKDMWLAMNQGTVEAFPTQSGYFLPWHGGLTGNLSRSVGHDADFTTAHFAFDFYFPGNTVCPGGQGMNSGTQGANFSIYASRAGTVWGWDDSVEDCNHSEVNFIVLRNIDNPTLFQLYMHLSQGSIPPALKSVGAPVARGQFLALADNTGNSTGSHLHFQIEHQPFWPGPNPYWNTALEMTFDDVDINGGRPRVITLDPPFCKPEDVCDTFRSSYVSNNYYLGDSTPPTGVLSGVNNGDVVKTQSITLNATGTDAQTGLDYGQLMAYFDDSWHNLGGHFNPSISYTWDLCNTQLPVNNGPVSVAMLLYDIAGNPAPRVGLRHFTKDFSCPVPPTTCVPAQNQITLFEDAFYKGGCVKYNVGNYPTWTSLNPLGDDDGESIMVGANVIATLYSDENYSGHSEAFLSNTGLLKYHWVDANMISSMKVTQRTTTPQAPSLVYPSAGSIFRQGDVVSFSWRNGGNASEYQVEIYLNNALYRSLSWQAAPVANVDSLPMGDYRWRAQARDAAGTSSWSQESTFSIESPIVIPGPESVPYNDDMETSRSKWVSSVSGFWTYKDDGTKAHSGTHSWWYQNGLGDYNGDAPSSGTLTSPPFSIISAGYYLRFYYRNQTETQGTTWDQRWVQVSVDQGPFINLVQIYDDPQMPETTSWMRTKAIDLSPYAGHNIRIRFQFTTFDAVANNFPGWGIDDFSITATPPAACEDDRLDDTPGQAFLLVYDPATTVAGAICPNGDYDYYKFSGAAGDQIVADINAMSNGSPLDSYLYLLDSDGATVLTENDDEVYAERRDPLLSYKLPHSGTFYLKLKAWKHPLIGGDEYFYTIRLYRDNAKPVATITNPVSESYLPDTTLTITAQVNEVVNGVNRVEFYWHPTDWIVGDWTKLGTDWDGSDGWSMEFNPAGQSEGKEAAVFIQVYDMAGNWAGVGAWDLGIDKTPPTTALLPLDAAQPSNAFFVTWTGTDNLSGIDYFNIQESLNSGNWVTLPPVDEGISGLWIIGSPGNNYAYRMGGVDHSGNTENYPAAAETTTAVPAAQVICFAPDSYDTSGNDNSPANASTIYANGASQFHNFCNPLLPGYQNDEDWMRLDATNGQHFIIQSLAYSAPSAAQISLFAQDGTTLLAEAAASVFGGDTLLVWTSDRDGPVFIRLRHVDGRVIGKDVGGTILVRTGAWTYLPILHKK